MRSTVASSDSILSRWDANSSPTNSTLARASSMIWRISAGARRQFTSTSTALIFEAAKASSK